jgi:hypothetical protein
VVEEIMRRRMRGGRGKKVGKGFEVSEEWEEKDARIVKNEGQTCTREWGVRVYVICGVGEERGRENIIPDS